MGSKDAHQLARAFRQHQRAARPEGQGAVAKHLADQVAELAVGVGGDAELTGQAPGLQWSIGTAGDILNDCLTPLAGRRAVWVARHNIASQANLRSECRERGCPGW